MFCLPLCFSLYPSPPRQPSARFGGMPQNALGSERQVSVVKCGVSVVRYLETNSTIQPTNQPTSFHPPRHPRSRALDWLSINPLTVMPCLAMRSTVLSCLAAFAWILLGSRKSGSEVSRSLSCADGYSTTALPRQGRSRRRGV